MFYIFQVILRTYLSAVEQTTEGRCVKYCTPFAPYSHCPQNNGMAIRFQHRGALKPRGTALESQEVGER